VPDSRLEVWASPEPTVARIDADTVRDQCAETGWSGRPDDVDRIAELGVGGCRFPVLWEHVAPRDPHVRDFRAQRTGIERLRARGVDPVVALEPELARAWGDAGARTARWTLALHVSRR